MSEKENDNENNRAAGCRNRRVWLAVIVVVLTAIIAYLVWSTYNSKSVEQQLAEIEAARAIPDSENATTIYNELFAEAEQTTRRPDFLTEDADWIAMHLPWTSEQYPELADWIKARRPIIDRLLLLSAFDKCCCPIVDPTDPVNPHMRNLLYAIRGWAHLLVRDANNDIAEGRIDNAITKFQCVTQMARHLSQQPFLLEYLYGNGVETFALQGLYRMLIETDLTETKIKLIEQCRPTTRDNWPDISPDFLRVEKLLSRKKLISEKTYGPLARLKAWWSDFSRKSSIELDYDSHLWIVSRRRAFWIIIELRHYKNKHANWPATLDEIKSSLPPEALIDPLNGGPFAYRTTGDTFKLYGKGKNNIDEDGRYAPPEFDPNTFQVILKEDDILFWPQNMPKKEDGNADPNPERKE